MKDIAIVGGNPTINKKSKIIDLISRNFKSPDVFNGEFCNNISKYDLTLWMIDVDNNIDKKYPIKKVGSILICSKVIRDDRTKYDAVSRIFKMNGNAVICIYKGFDKFYFELVDALGNTWGEKTSSIDFLCEYIKSFCVWSSSQKRNSLTQNDLVDSRFVDINRLFAGKVQSSIGSRFFGNASTRCMKLFPSYKIDETLFMFSSRNSDKESLTQDDFVLVKNSIDKIEFFGSKKPSVDTPVQIELYSYYNNINYMIHGHAFIKNGITTNEYFPCGDLREVKSVIDASNDRYSKTIILNLKNHGFLIGADCVEKLEDIYDEAVFIHHDILLLKD